MELKYRTIPENEGGGAIPDCGTIHKSEVKPTLDKLSDDLGFHIDLNDFAIGSTGKKEYSGDLDLVLGDYEWGHGPVAFKKHLDLIYNENDTRRTGTMIHLKYPIVNYKEELQERKPRTGFVQVDFIFGDVKWEKIFHFSAGAESEYKGFHRNILISAICTALATEVSDKLDTFGRPVSQIRWKFGPKGFVQVERVSTFNESSGKVHKKQKDTQLTTPVFDFHAVIGTLFPESNTLFDLDSVETLMNAVKRNYDKNTQEKVWKQIVYDLSMRDDAKMFIYPPEIAKYISENDK